MQWLFRACRLSDSTILSCSLPQILAPLLPVPRKLNKLVSGNRKNLRSSSAKAVYSGEVWAAGKSSPRGIWSIREDLQVPSSPYLLASAQGGQGPPPMVQERFQSVISQLFQYRIIRCGGAVDDDMANIIVAQLLYLDAVDPNKVCFIHLYKILDCADGKIFCFIDIPEFSLNSTVLSSFMLDCIPKSPLNSTVGNYLG
ncbi:unnamed protein product [Ilex paraguariensis]|uniref:Uncharacterized protein n=1 Tax=Ilex paraguariensis TaxID=185542 RepID=A0ABC8S6Q5_9AQUA